VEVWAGAAFSFPDLWLLHLLHMSFWWCNKNSFYFSGLLHLLHKLHYFSRDLPSRFFGKCYCRSDN
jgi:hypothetical protein